MKNYDLYDFSYLNYSYTNTSKNDRHSPFFSRAVENQQMLNQSFNNQQIYQPNRSRSNIKRSRSKTKTRENTNSCKIKSLKKNRKNNSNLNHIGTRSRSKSPQVLKDDNQIINNPEGNRSHSNNQYISGKSVNFIHEETKNIDKYEKNDEINILLKQNINKDRTDNDFHFNYNFKNEFYSNEGGYENGYRDANEYSKNYNNINYNSKYQNNQNRKIYEKLYNEADKLKVKKMILSNEIYSEKYGITFQPKTTKNSKYDPRLNFYERDENFLKSKKENLERMRREKSEKELSSIRKSRTLSKDERDLHTKNIVERLYKKQIEKLKDIENKRSEEEKKAELELKQRKKSKEEIQIHNKSIIDRLYNSELSKIKDKSDLAKKLNRDELQKNLEMIENKNLSKIKQRNKQKYNNVQSRVFNNNVNKNNENDSKSKRTNNNSGSPSKSHKSDLLKRLKEEHKIKFKNNYDLNNISKSKDKDNISRDYDHNETRIIKQTEENSPVRNDKENNNTKNPLNLMDSINSNNRNSLRNSNSSVRDSLRRSINSKTGKPFKAADINKKNFANNSDYLLESNIPFYKKTDSIESRDKNNYDNYERNRNYSKMNSSIKDYTSLSPIRNEKSEFNNDLSGKSSYKENDSYNQNSHFKSKLSDKMESSINNSKYNLISTANNNNSNTCKETNFSNNSRLNRNELANIKDVSESNTGGHTDNSDNSKGFENKENKFKSKGLEKILSGRK